MIAECKLYKSLYEGIYKFLDSCNSDIEKKDGLEKAIEIISMSEITNELKTEICALLKSYIPNDKENEDDRT